MRPRGAAVSRDEEDGSSALQTDWEHLDSNQQEPLGNFSVLSNTDSNNLQ